MRNKKGTSHEDQRARLTKIEGQIRGVINMIDNQRYCIDILHQFKAIRSGLQAVERNIIDQHLTHCVKKAVSSKKTGDANKMLDEVRNFLKLAVLK
ncbi:metal-sensitive transcriptional regulator [bacterium]|nr:metal-sensitive transcriptional regulator [bacterium]